MEALTYDNDMEFQMNTKLAMNIFESDLSVASSSSEDEEKSFRRHHSMAIVFFDLETSGFYKTDDILQVAMKYEDSVFNKYANPTKYISPEASAVHRLTNDGSKLYLRGVKVKSEPLRTVLLKLLLFLIKIGKPCVLVAHNCNFDSSRLLVKLKEFSLIEEYREVVKGFIDSLTLFKKRFPNRKEKGSLKLTTLAEELMNMSSKNAHDAMFDVILLEKLVRKFFSYNDLVQNVKSFDFLVEGMDKEEKSLIYLKTLEPLASIVSKLVLKRMAYAGITYKSILREFKKSEKHVIDLLEQRIEGKPQVIKKKSILNDILKHLKSLCDVSAERERRRICFV